MSPPLVLVVDDDVLVRLNTSAIFEDAGFEVLEARDAAGALLKLRERREIRLICTDVHMPGDLNGVDLAREVADRYPHLPVIMVSGDRRSEALARDIPFIAKPFLPQRLIDVARTELARPAQPAKARVTAHRQARACSSSR
jgi:DNA-binding NtrC family response regulator